MRYTTNCQTSTRSCRSIIPATSTIPRPPWWPNVEEWSYTGLNTLRGSLDTVHEQLRPEQRMHEEEVLAALYAFIG